MIMMDHESRLAKKKLEDKKIVNDGKKAMGSMACRNGGVKELLEIFEGRRVSDRELD